MIKKRTVSQCVSSDYCQGWNDAVEEMPKWRSAKDDPPKLDKSVIVATEYGAVFAAMLIEKDGNIYWTNAAFDYAPIGITTGEVTHWQPFPAHPKELEL